jgi:hypothetical protein
MSAVERCADGLVLRLYIQPKASRDSIVGVYLAFGDAELFGEKFHQMGIGLAINGRGGNGDFELVAYCCRGCGWRYECR